MIKLWKSSAKGRSGCPVRPPEQSSSSMSLPGTTNNYTLEIILEEGEYMPPISEPKKSRLTKSINDILSDKNTLSYFVQYMESNSAIQLITFWLEVEYFKQTATEFLNGTSDQVHGKLTRTTSLESSIKLKNISEAKNYLSTGKSCQNIDVDTIMNANKTDGSESVNDCKFGDHIRLENTKLLSDKKPILDDAINLFKKYIALEAPHRLDLADSIRNTVVKNICHPDGVVDINCFKVVQDLVFERLKSYEEGFLQSPLYAKAQIDILTNGSLTLDDILYNEMTLFYFTEYLEQEGCSILLEFLMVLTNFSNNLVGVYDSDQAQDDAIVLYDKYFSLQAINPIGFPTDIRLLVEQNICREGGPLPDCFHKPFRIVHHTLSRYVKQFLESELYFKYLTEMVNSVDKMWSKKSLSDCSSEFCINTQNTLLAMGDLQFRSKRRNHSVPDMSIASNSMYNADSLWHRNKQEGLSLGWVNSLGRFESKLEPDPDKKRVSMLRKMVNKLVPATDRVDEEMAWQVAHMIVKDVTDLTMYLAHSDK